jgi:hypothetical protein
MTEALTSHEVSHLTGDIRAVPHAPAPSLCARLGGQVL